MCGENQLTPSTAQALVGSSPRVRGKQRRHTWKFARPRLIPACAGKTAVSYSSKRALRAHPRVCGENPTLPVDDQPRAGSSPRVRGKPMPNFIGDLTRRLIPACAGKTTKCAPWKAARPAHPRVCGENGLGVAQSHFAAGSSPRVRGKLREARNHFRMRGLIPACAGKTCPRPGYARSTRAHPRVCGENSLPPEMRKASAGSSPRVRGKQVWPFR